MEVEDYLQSSLDHAQCSVSEIQQNKLSESFLKGIPLAYLQGVAEFYYQKFYINQHVLIPRPETEYLVDLIVSEYKGQIHNVLDVGTGAGTILLSLLKCGVGSTGTGTDICGEALEVAKINSARFRLENLVTLTQCDRLTQVSETFDLIVSNPPYIKSSAHRSLVHDSVHIFEPSEALYLPDHSYDAWFEEFFKAVKHHLRGTFFMEGHEFEILTQAQKLYQLGFKNVQVLKDLTGTDRFLKAQVK